MATPSVLVVGSTGSIGRHVVHAAALRGLGIRALSRDAARANRAFAGIPGVEVVQGDATEPASLLRFVDAVDAVILVHGDDSRPEGVDYGVVPALLGALNGRRPHVALMSSINATDASGPYADLLTWKRRGERLLRASGLPTRSCGPDGSTPSNSPTTVPSSLRATRRGWEGCAANTSLRRSSRRSSRRRHPAEPWRSSPGPARRSPTGTRSSRQPRRMRPDPSTEPWTRQISRWTANPPGSWPIWSASGRGRRGESAAIRHSVEAHSPTSTGASWRTSGRPLGYHQRSHK